MAFPRSGVVRRIRRPNQGTSQPSVPKAGDFDFLSALTGFAKGPWGAALAGVPVVMDALGRQDPSDPLGGSLAAGASLLGGGGAIALSRLPMPPMAKAALMIGAAPIGGIFGGVTRSAADAVRGIVNDPTSRTIRDNERLQRSAIEAGFRELPLVRAQADLARQDLEARQLIADASEARRRYQAAVLGAAAPQRGVYLDPNFSAALGGIAQQALV